MMAAFTARCVIRPATYRLDAVQPTHHFLTSKTYSPVLFAIGAEVVFDESTYIPAFFPIMLCTTPLRI